MSGYLPPGCTQRECDAQLEWDDVVPAAELDLVYEDLARARKRIAELEYMIAEIRRIPITQGADRDLVILSALKAAHAFITNPTRVTHEGSLCRSEYLFSSCNFADLDKLMRNAMREMGAKP